MHRGRGENRGWQHIRIAIDLGNTSDGKEVWQV